jgi:hypothetical protein
VKIKHKIYLNGTLIHSGITEATDTGVNELVYIRFDKPVRVTYEDELVMLQEIERSQKCPTSEKP